MRIKLIHKKTKLIFFLAALLFSLMFFYTNCSNGRLPSALFMTTGLSYSPDVEENRKDFVVDTYILTVGAEFSPIIPAYNLTGGAPTAYILTQPDVSNSLIKPPPGINFDARTGIFSGQPTQVFPATTYIVKALKNNSPTFVEIRISVIKPVITISDAPAISEGQALVYTVSLDTTYLDSLSNNLPFSFTISGTAESNVDYVEQNTWVTLVAGSSVVNISIPTNFRQSFYQGEKSLNITLNPTGLTNADLGTKTTGSGVIGETSPRITQIFPGVGPTTGGGAITISGANFASSGVSVDLGGAACAVQSSTATSIVCVPGSRTSGGKVNAVVSLNNQSHTLLAGYIYGTILTISASVTHYDIYANYRAAVGNSISTSAFVILYINSGVTVYSNAYSSGWVPALKTGTGWPAGSEVVINNNGSIFGASSSSKGDKSTNQAYEGGAALLISIPTTLNNNGQIIGGYGSGGYTDGDSCCGSGNGGSYGGQGGAGIICNAQTNINMGSGAIIYAGGGGGGSGGGGNRATYGSGYGGNGQGTYNGVGYAAEAGGTGYSNGGSGGSYGLFGGDGGAGNNGAGGGGPGGWAIVKNGSSVKIADSEILANSSYNSTTWITGTKGRIAP